MEPACVHSEECAGCPLMGLPYTAQLAQKRALLLDALAPYPALEGVPVAETAPADPLIRYRRRAKWMVDESGALGLYARDGSFRVVDIPGCQVVDEALVAVGAALRALLRPRHPGLVGLTAVDLRALRGPDAGAWVTLVFVRGRVPAEADLRALAQALSRRVPLRSLFVNEVEEGAVQVLGPRTRVVFGPEESDDDFAGARLRAAPGSFLQAHEGQSRGVAGALVAQLEALEVREPGTRERRVLDLFAGTGSWSLALAQRGAHVLAVESFAPAAARLQASARAQGFAVEARAESAEAACRALAESGARFDLIVVNPPRRGLSPGLRAAIALLGARRVAYLSCDPSTLARDLSELARLGLRAESLAPIDMIPLTAQVETLALLAPGPSTMPLPLATSPWGAAYDKAGHEDAQELQRRLAGLPGITAGLPGVLLFAPEPEQSGVSLFGALPAGALPPDLAPERAPDLERAEATVLVAVQGVCRARGKVTDRGRGGLRFQRLSVSAGHSLVEVRAALADLPRVGLLLARIGHPPLGGAHAKPRARRHLEDRYGLDRAFFHVARVDSEGRAFEAPLAPDLSAVARRLGFDHPSTRRNAPPGVRV